MSKLTETAISELIDAELDEVFGGRLNFFNHVTQTNNQVTQTNTGVQIASVSGLGLASIFQALGQSNISII